MIKKLITSIETGVDQAVRDFSGKVGISCEASEDPWHNLEKSDGTLAMSAEGIFGETASLVGYAKELKKPCLVLDLNHYPSPQLVVDWVEKYDIKTLNVTGPDESVLPGIYKIAYEFLIAVFYAFPQAVWSQKK